MSELVAENKVVLIDYTLKNDDGIVLDASNGDAMPYLHGSHMIVPGLERALDGHAVDDVVDVVVPAAEGYGERHDAPRQKVPRTEFPPDAEFTVGMPVMAQTDGGPIPLWIAAVEDDHIELDLNHPMAGVTLHFSVKIVGIRDATEEEIAHGHPHGPGGHHH